MNTEIEIKLPKPHVNQKKILKSKSRFKVVLAGRRFGKSLIAQIISITKMLNADKVGYVTPTFDLAKTFFNELVAYIPQQLIRIANKSDLQIDLITGGSIKFFSAEAIQRFRGNHFDYVILDEAAFLNLKDSWGEVILPTLIDSNGGALLISTPNGREYFFSLYIKGMNNEDGYESFHFTTFDNPTLAKEQINELVKHLTEEQKKQEIYAIAGESTSNPISADAIYRNTITTLSNEPAIIYGIDVTYGTSNDWTVITGLDNKGIMSYFDRFQTTNNLIKFKIELLPADILKVMDSTAGGQVLFEQLQQTCSNLDGFKFTSQSKPELIVNLIRDIEADKLKFNETTANELAVFEYKITSTGYVKYEAQQGYHDDTVMALAIANKYKNEAVFAANWKIY